MMRPANVAEFLVTFRDVKRGEGVHHPQPGHETGAGQATQPHIPVTKQGEVSGKRRFGVGVRSVRNRLAEKSPKQQAD